MPNQDDIAYKVSRGKAFHDPSVIGIPGVPKDDLTHAQFKALTKQQQMDVEASELYRKVEPPAEDEQPRSTRRKADAPVEDAPAEEGKVNDNAS